LLCCECIRRRAEQPISSCIREASELQKNKGGLGITSLKSLAEKSRLQSRSSLKNSRNREIQELWNETSCSTNIRIDELLLNKTDIKTAQATLSKLQKDAVTDHFFGLTIQGKIAQTVNQVIPSNNIKAWSTCLESTTSVLHNFAIKAFKQVLPTASNLLRWKKRSDASCPLCGSDAQTNKHVLSNCNSPQALTRYTDRHNAVLKLIIDWISSRLPNSYSLYADLPNSDYPSTDSLFDRFRPDIVISNHQGKLFVIELTVCHETNLINSRNYKLNKYRNLITDCKINTDEIKIFTIEVSTLGFIAGQREIASL